MKLIEDNDGDDSDGASDTSPVSSKDDSKEYDFPDDE